MNTTKTLDFDGTLGGGISTDAAMASRENLAANLKYLRRRENLSQTELAEKAEVSQSVISNLERADAYARLDILEKLAPAFGEEVWGLTLPYEVLSTTEGHLLKTFRQQSATLTETDHALFLTLFQKLLALFHRLPGS